MIPFYINCRFDRTISFIVISTERSEWRNLYKDVSTSLDMTGIS